MYHRIKSGERVGDIEEKTCRRLVPGVCLSAGNGAMVGVETGGSGCPA